MKKCAEYCDAKMSNILQREDDFWRMPKKGIPMNVLAKTGGLVFLTSKGADAEGAHPVFRPESERNVEIRTYGPSIRQHYRNPTWG